MLFDLVYEIGGQGLVDCVSDFIFPIYSQICDLAVNSWWWEAIANGMETILT